VFVAVQESGKVWRKVRNKNKTTANADAVGSGRTIAHSSFFAVTHNTSHALTIYSSLHVHSATLFARAMDLRHRAPPTVHDGAIHHPNRGGKRDSSSTPSVSSPKASDALPLPLYLTNAIFFTLFFSVAYFLLHRWRDKIRSHTPLHVVTLSEIAAIFSLIASFIYLLGFFGIDFVQSFITRASHDAWDVDEAVSEPSPAPSPSPSITKLPPVECSLISEDDEDIVCSVVDGVTPSYALESRLGDCRRAAAIRRAALQRMTGRSLEGLPLEGFDYDSILGQCCEMPVGYVQIPVGVAGPLLLDGFEYTVPMATTEGCLVASTNRGCKAIYASGGASSVVLRDCMSRAPVVRFSTAKRAAQLKFFLEDPLNFDTLAVVFNRFVLVLSRGSLGSWSWFENLSFTSWCPP